MSVYKKFADVDILDYTIHASNRVILASGTLGWRGNTGTSGSMGMHGGFRDRGRVLDASGDVQINVQPRYRLTSFDASGELYVTGSYPLTGSVSYVKVRNTSQINPANVTNQDWYDEHFRPILNLYSYYSAKDPDYVTSSYDFYSLYIDRNAATSENRVTHTATGAHLTTYNTLSSSYTLEARVKPFSVDASERYTILSRLGIFEFFVTGSTLSFSASDGSAAFYSSSLALTRNRWQHVAFRVGDGVGKFTINMVDAGTHVVTGSIDSGVQSSNIYVGNIPSASFTAFHGLIYDAKIWNVERTFLQLSSSFKNTYEQSGSSPNLILYDRMNDGPLASYTGITKGSGTFDHSQTSNHGTVTSFNGRHAPIWMPCDDTSFTTQKKFVTGSTDFMRVIHVPSLYYGRQIATGSIKIVDNTFVDHKIVRTIVDDGRGNLYFSGSVGSSSLGDKESYDGVSWNKVGNVFYTEGIIVIKNPALFDVGDDDGTSTLPNDLLQISFNGLTRTPSKIMMCRVNGAEANASNNVTFSNRNPQTGKLDIVREKPVTYITAVGIYDKERKLVAVAKMAQPIRNRERDRINIRLKMDF